MSNTLITNPCSNISAFVATLNATLNTKDHALYFYGFVWMEGVSGDPRYGESGVSSGRYYTDLEAGTSYSYQLRLKANTTYRVAALAVDGTTFEFFYGETVDLVTPEFVHTPFTGIVKIEGVPWTGEIVTIGEGKEFPSLYEATEWVNAQAAPCVFIIYGDFDSVEDSYFRYDSYVVGIGSPEIAIKSGFNGRSGFETLENLTKFYIDNLSIVVDNSISWSRRLIEDWVGGAMKFNKVYLEIQNSGGGADLLESCAEPTLNMQNITLNISNIVAEADHHINIPSSAAAESSLSKIAYNMPWTQHGLDGVSVDNAVIGTNGYGYEYGTAGALIQISSTPTSGKKVMVRK